MAVGKHEFEKYKAMRGGDHYLSHLLTMSMNDAGNNRIDAWLKETGLIDKLIVGVVAVYDDDEHCMEAWAKVIVRGQGRRGSFEHREKPYYAFPSDHFKTKLLLVAG